MSVALIVIAYILGIAGIIGSVVPGLPGPPISWAGLLVAYFAKSITTTTLLIWLAITIIVTVLAMLFQPSSPGCPAAQRLEAGEQR
ncbi:MAG: DUF456 family protein [Spirochaetia bacterium]|nr:DUF456 family protein [Spirochaetia bacterium]